MTSSPSRARAVGVVGLLVAALVGCGSDDDDEAAQRDEWCALVERATTMVRELDIDAVEAGDPEAVALADQLEQIFVEGRQIEAPAEIRESWELAIDPASSPPVPPPGAGEAQKDVEAYALDHCDFPDELRDELSGS